MKESTVASEVYVSVGSHIRQLGSETIVYGISSTIARFIGIFLVPLYTRVFSPSDYGVIAIITSFTALLTTFVVLGLDNSSARWFYDSQDGSRRKSIITSWFWTQNLVSWAAALIIVFTADDLAFLLFGTSEHGRLLRLVAFLIPLGTFGKVLGNWLRYQRKAWFTALYFTTTSLVTIGMVLLFVLGLRRGLSGLYTAQILSATLAAFIAIASLRSWINPRKISPTILKEMLVFGLPFVPASIAAWVTTSSDRLIINFYLDMSEVGIYSIAATLASAVALATTAFQMAWGPFAYSILHKPESSLVYSKVLSIYAWGSCLLATAMTLFAPLLLTIFTTPKFYGAASSVPFLVFSQILIGSRYILSIGSSIAKKSFVVAGSMFISAGASVLMNFLLIPLIGRDGAGISSLVAYSASVIFLYAYSQHHYPLPYRVKEILVFYSFAWLLIGINHFFLPPSGLFPFLIRLLLCMLFVPLAFWADLVKPEHILRLWRKIIHYSVKTRS
jgi:O-antigen/teichoic acid export membrane protein